MTISHALRVGTYSADVSVRAMWLIYALSAVGAAFVVYAVRPWRMWREDWRIETAKVAADGVTELVLRGPEETSLDLRGGQFLWLTVSPYRPPFHDHPFSVASSAGFLPRLRLLVARAGNCTDSFHELTPGTRVALDGPHGSFVLPNRTSAIVMLAGGVGIAPILGMLEEAAERGDRRPFRLLYAARSEAALTCRGKLSELGRRLDFKVTYCVDETCPAPGILRGPICGEHLRQLASGLALGDTSVMLCGPTGMMEAAADTFLSLGSPVANIHYERFDFGAGKGWIDRRRRAAALLILAVVAASAVAFSLR